MRKANIASALSEESGDEDSLFEANPSSTEPKSESEAGNALSLDGLSLLYRVNEKEGWYIDSYDNCYYLVVQNREEKQFKVVYSRLSLSLLDMLAEQVVSV